ncbi:ATP-dependent DNA ligase [Bacillus gibsonii]|nr:ATP-dependent DNA ligase [Alkalicoccobacillus gibsonii]
MFKSPMLLQSLPVPPDNDIECITELKLDGHRMIMSRFEGKTRLYTRHQNEVTTMYPELLEHEIEEGTMLDGELVALDDEGKPDFESLQLRSRSKKLFHQVPLQFVAFDSLYHQYKRMTSKPLHERKEKVAISLPKNQQTLVAHNFVIGQAQNYFQLVKEMDLEGIVVKDPNSVYKINTRSKAWHKIINYSYRDVLVTKLRKKEFGLVVTDEKGHYLGTIEHASIPLRKSLYSLAKVRKEDTNYVEIDPLPCRVKYRNLTKKGLLCIPVLIEVTPDN